MDEDYTLLILRIIPNISDIYLIPNSKITVYCQEIFDLINCNHINSVSINFIKEKYNDIVFALSELEEMTIGNGRFAKYKINAPIIGKSISQIIVSGWNL
jgi:hypothetical protein